MAQVFDIKNWERGTTPPITIRMRNEETNEPMTLAGCRIVMVVRDEKWEDSLNDDTARIKRRADFYQVTSLADLPISIPTPIANDIAWVTDIDSPRLWNGAEWVEVNRDENNITEGIYTIRFTRSDVMLPVGTYYYSIDIRYSNGEIGKICKGKFVITYNSVNEV
jgi:hypothetical protein